LHLTGKSDSILRENTKYGFVGISAGLHFDYAVTQPIRIGYYPTTNTSIAAEYGYTSFDFDKYDIFHQFNGNYQHASVVHRYFPFENSFNIRQSVTQNTFNTKIHTKIEDTVNTPFKNSNYTYTTYKNVSHFYGLGLGSQWNFRQGWFLGFDYVFKQWLLRSYSKQTVTTDSEQTSSELSKAEKDLIGFEKTVNNLQAHTGIAILSLGLFF